MLLAGCFKKQDIHAVLLISHAGMGLNIPNSIYHDNSREAVELACSMMGCDGVEIDVQLSKDEELWLYHDATLDTETNGVGCIADMINNQLSQLTYSSFHKESLCRLADIPIESFQGKNIFFDLRHLNSCTSKFVSVDTMVARLTTLQLNPDRIFVITNYEQWIDPLKQAGFSVLFQLEMADGISQTADAADGFMIRNSLITKEQVKKIKDAGKKLFIFDIRSPKGIRSAFGKHPDGVLSDDIRASIIEKN
jgi:glycerophosphoryl diester phosphodiesterase